MKLKAPDCSAIGGDVGTITVVPKVMESVSGSTSGDEVLETVSCCYLVVACIQ